MARYLWIGGLTVLLVVACGGKSGESEAETGTPAQAEHAGTEAMEKGGSDRMLNASSTAEERINVATEHKDEMLDLEGDETATVKTSRGDVTVKFYKDAAPKHVNNFIKLSKLGFYDGLTFHRYVQDFVIQGGDPLGTGTGDAGYEIPLEVDESAKHKKGALGMARGPAPNSASCQFYICLEAAHGLDMQYTVFGEVTDGMDAVMELRQGDTIERIDVHEN
jgi:cyclophilin family peptidyl-prolyl cis-trans isomerase